MINLLNGLNSFLLARAPNDWLPDFIKDLRVYVFVFLVAVAAVGTGYGIYLAFLIAKADSPATRGQAKSRIIKVMAALAFIVFLATFFITMDVGDATGRDTSEWRLGLPSNDTNTGDARFCTMCFEWQILVGIHTIDLYRRPAIDDPKFKGVGFNYKEEYSFSARGGPPSNPDLTVGAVRLRFLSWTAHPPGSGTRAPLPLSEHTKQIPPLPEQADATHVKEVTGILGNTIDVEIMGSTGRQFRIFGEGILQLSVEYFDVEKGSFQLPFPITVMRAIANASSFCTKNKCRN